MVQEDAEGCSEPLLKFDMVLLNQEATVSLLSAQAFTEQLATGHGPSGPEGGFDGRDGRRTVDRGLLTGSGATAAAVVAA